MTEQSGLVVREWGGGWGVYHKDGLPVVEFLRQRRFAEEALTELLATGVDFTADPATIQKLADQWRTVYYKWRQRARAEEFDPITGEYYSTHTHYGTFLPSAKWAAAYREALAANDSDRMRQLADEGNKAVRDA